MLQFPAQLNRNETNKPGNDVQQNKTQQLREAPLLFCKKDGPQRFEDRRGNIGSGLYLCPMYLLLATQEPDFIRKYILPAVVFLTLYLIIRFILKRKG